MKRKAALVLLFSLIAVNLASAGILRHVVKPVVKTTGQVIVKTAKVAKHVAY